MCVCESVCVCVSGGDFHRDFRPDKSLVDYIPMVVSAPLDNREFLAGLCSIPVNNLGPTLNNGY